MLACTALDYLRIRQSQTLFRTTPPHISPPHVFLCSRKSCILESINWTFLCSAGPGISACSFTCPFSRRQAAQIANLTAVATNMILKRAREDRRWTRKKTIMTLCNHFPRLPREFSLVANPRLLHCLQAKRHHELPDLVQPTYRMSQFFCRVIGFSLGEYDDDFGEYRGCDGTENGFSVDQRRDRDLYGPKGTVG